MSSFSSPQARVAWIIAAWLIGVVLAAVLLRLAWVGDDTYITLRTVENIATGHGAVWNAGERLQCYTHPLWMLLLTGARLCTGECYFGTIALSYVLAITAVALLALRAGRCNDRSGGRSGGAVAVAVVMWLLLWSRAFTEFAVSGLENPLTFALLAFLILAVESRPADASPAGDARAAAASKTRRLAVLVGLLATTRLDLVVLAGPVLLSTLRAAGVARWSIACLLGLLPLWLWLLFATVYYGTPLPITAYAKLSHGLPALTMLEQGLHHVVFMVLYDPLTLLVIGAGLVSAFSHPRAGSRWLAVGVLAYVAYIVKVGGDFMAGRFFSPPFFVALALLTPMFAVPSRRWLAALALILAAALGFIGGVPKWLVAPASETEPVWHHRGILDERSAYVREVGLFAPTRDVLVPGGATASLQQLGRTRPLVASAGKAGIYAFEGGTLMHFFDPLLCDALLARLPASPTAEWRVGHIPREIPAGYLESIAFGDNRVVDPGLRRYYDALRQATAGELFAGERWSALWQLWSGAFDAELESYAAGPYLTPPRREVAGSAIASARPSTLPGVGALWFDDDRVRVVQRGGLRVRFATAVTASRIAMQLAGGFRYRIRCSAGDAPPAVDVEVDLLAVSQLLGLVPHVVDLERAITFDRIDIDLVDPVPHFVAAVGQVLPE